MVQQGDATGSVSAWRWLGGAVLGAVLLFLRLVGVERRGIFGRCGSGGEATVSFYWGATENQMHVLEAKRAK